MNKSTATSVDASKERGLGETSEQPKYMLPSPLRNAGQNRDVTIADKSFKYEARFK
jgi:hypothetical protein